MNEIHLTQPILNVVDLAKKEVEKGVEKLGEKVKKDAVSGKKVKGKYKSVDDVLKEFRKGVEKAFDEAFAKKWEKFHPIGENPRKPPRHLVVEQKVRFSADQLNNFRERENLKPVKRKGGLFGKRKQERMEADRRDVEGWLTPQQVMAAERERQKRDGPSGNLSSGTYRGRGGMEQARRQARHYKSI
ncbi:hypothetical protein ACFOVU_09430 [Nocardiopsis sediminis]|uniref:Uncharacterized protein n=1 Tax=Nocardiopsis sediminis TaxID=1778267 RepID=A0ABV8FL94_9ACTN